MLSIVIIIGKENLLPKNTIIKVHSLLKIIQIISKERKIINSMVIINENWKKSKGIRNCKNIVIFMKGKSITKEMMWEEW